MRGQGRSVGGVLHLDHSRLARTPDGRVDGRRDDQPQSGARGTAPAQARPGRAGQDHRAIGVPFTRVIRGQSRSLPDTRTRRPAPTTAMRGTPSKLVMRVRFPSPAPIYAGQGRFLSCRFCVANVRATYVPHASRPFIELVGIP